MLSIEKNEIAAPAAQESEKRRKFCVIGLHVSVTSRVTSPQALVFETSHCYSDIEFEALTRTPLLLQIKTA